MKTCKEKAAEWGIAERTVTYFCNNNRIPGAVKEKAGKFPGAGSCNREKDASYRDFRLHSRTVGILLCG